MSYIIPTLCRSCGMCEEACPVGAVYEKFGRYRINDDLCTDCGVCRSTCPQHYPAPDSLRVTAYDAARERRIKELREQERLAAGQELRNRERLAVPQERLAVSQKSLAARQERLATHQAGFAAYQGCEQLLDNPQIIKNGE